MPKGKVVDVPYSLNESKPNWTAHAASTASSGDGETEAELGTFLCPVGLKQLRRSWLTGHRFALSTPIVPAASR